MLISLIEFFKRAVPAALFFTEKKSATFYCWKRKIDPNKFASRKPLQIFHDGGHTDYRRETSPVICYANQRIGSYMIGNSVMKELMANSTERTSSILDLKLIINVISQYIHGIQYISISKFTAS